MPQRSCAHRGGGAQRAADAAPAFYDGWLVRMSPGKAKRARSVNAHFGSTLPVDAKIERCVRLYSDCALPALFRITPYCKPAALDNVLVARRNGRMRAACDR